MTAGDDRSPHLPIEGLAAGAAAATLTLAEAHAARETALRSCRATIQAAGRSIRATHRLDPGTAADLVLESGDALAAAQDALRAFPAIAGAGFLHDAEKEYAEAVLCAALVEGRPAPSAGDLGVAPAAWLNGLAEAASELRRHTLDTLRRGDLERGEALLDLMDQVFGVLVSVDFPDAVTGGLRRTTDALRAVLERTRSDVTTTVLQARLEQTLRAALSTGTGSAGDTGAALT